MKSRTFTKKWITTLTVVVFIVLLQVDGFPQQSREKIRILKPGITKISTPLVTSTVGEKKNYNLKDYTQYSIGTIEWVPSQNRYQARVGFTGAEGFVFFNSYHQSFADAQHAINFVKDGKGNGYLYNIFAETIEVHTTPTPGPNGETTVVEVLSLIYSFNI
jgi:hypothetical protein